MPLAMQASPNKSAGNIGLNKWMRHCSTAMLLYRLGYIAPYSFHFLIRKMLKAKPVLCGLIIIIINA